jgi:hypothetical protein
MLLNLRYNYKTLGVKPRGLNRRRRLNIGKFSADGSLPVSGKLLTDRCIYTDKKAVKGRVCG